MYDVVNTISCRIATAWISFLCPTINLKNLHRKYRIINFCNTPRYKTDRWHKLSIFFIPNQKFWFQSKNPRPSRTLHIPTNRNFGQQEKLAKQPLHTKQKDGAASLALASPRSSFSIRLPFLICNSYLSIPVQGTSVYTTAHPPVVSAQNKYIGDGSALSAST